MHVLNKEGKIPISIYKHIESICMTVLLIVELPVQKSEPETLSDNNRAERKSN